MRKIILPEDKGTIPLWNVNNQNPIFAKKDGKLTGMIIQDNTKNYSWILKLGGAFSANGYHDTLQECLETCSKFGYTFFTE